MGLLQAFDQQKKQTAAPTEPAAPPPQPSGSGLRSAFQGGAPSGATTTQSAPVALPPGTVASPSQWDYKTAKLGPHGEALPPNAKGWTPYGQPFFGDGLSGKLKEYAWSFTKDVQHSDSSEWDQMKQKWNDLWSQSTGQVNMEQGKIALQGVALGAQAVGTWWKDMESNKQSILSPVLRATGVGLQAIGDLFSIPAQILEKGISAKEGFQQAANEVNSPLPKLEQNKFTQFLEETPLGLAYDAVRVALSPDAGNIEQTWKRIDEGWNAGRIFYASVFDNTLREDYVRRYQAGEDPELLAMEISNRNVQIWGHDVNANLIEMGGQLVLDPLNFVGVFTKGAEVNKLINKASDIGGIFRDTEATAALKVITEATDDLKAADAWKTIATAQQKAVQAVEEGRILGKKWTPTALTVASRENALTGVASDFIGLSAGSMIREGFQKEDLIEAFKFGIKSVSKDMDEVQEGIAALAKLPNAPRWMGDDAIMTFKTIRNFVTNEHGVTDLSKLDKLFSKQADFSQFIEEASKLIKDASKNQFASINDMAEAANAVKEAAKTGAMVSKKTEELAKMYDTVPAYAKLLNNVNDSKIGKVRQAINNTLGKFYFNYQGGVAVKNVLSNNVLIGIDDGFKAFAGFDEVVKDGKVFMQPKVWSDGAITDNLGKWFADFKPAATSGFETAVSASTGGAKTNVVGKLMEWGESTGAARVFDGAVRDTMKKLLKMDFLGDKSKLIGAGFNEQDLAHIERLLYAEKGDVIKTMEAFRAYKGGKDGAQTVEAWRTLDFLTKRDIEILDDLGIYDKLHDMTKTAQTEEEVAAEINKLKKTFGQYAEDAVNDVPGLSEKNPALESFGLLSDAENTGHLEKGASAIFATVMEASDNAQKEFMGMLNKSIDSLLMNEAIPKAERSALADARQVIFDGLNKSGGETKRVSDSLVKNAWHYTDNFKAELKQVGGDYGKLWKKMKLEGMPPADLNQRGLLQELWKTTKERQDAIWRGHFDKAFADSENLVKSMGNYMDPAALESQFKQSRWAVSKAQEYRKAVYENGALRIKPMDNILWMAKEYGIPSATEAGAPLEKNILNIINNTSDEFTPYVNRRITEEAQRLAGELSSGQVEKGAIGNIMGSSNVDWYKQTGKKKSALDAALQKVISGEGRKSTNVDLMREKILENFQFGDAASGTPPDLYVLQQLGADNKTMETALQNFNDITRQEMSLKEAIKASAPAADTAGKYAKIEDVPPQEALKAFEKWRMEKGKPPVKLTGFAIPPAHADGAFPSMGRAWSENLSGVNYMLDRVQNQITTQWGRRVDAPFNPQMEAALQDFMRGAASRVDEAKIIATKVGTEQRNFTLLNYGQRTYADVAASWIMPYHFWYTRQYGNWVKRLATSPEVVAGYAKYKSAMEKVHYDMPDFFKQNVDLSKPLEMIGIKTSSPIFLNLEAAVNPLYGLTGSDFNDPEKRVDWFSNTLDDMGKFGPSIWSPLQIANAVRLSLKGETDAAARWGGRIFPETAQLKQFLTANVGSLRGGALGEGVANITKKITTPTGLNIGGVKIPFELDPAVWLFSGGLDPFERNRVGRALGGLIGQTMPDGTVITKEMAIEAARTQTGDLWDQANVSANQMRAGPGGVNTLSSWIFGVGFKPRTQADMQIDQMFADVAQLRAYNKGGVLTADQYKQQWDALTQKYPFMETVMLSRRGGSERDSAYAFNVLGRIPPGDSYKILSSIGLDDATISKFYNDRGDFTKWTPQDKDRFMASMLDLGATYALPDGATKQEWTEVKGNYQDMRATIAKALGDDIWDKLSTYYDLQDTNKDQANNFRDEHPEITQALQLKREMIINDPLVYKYYGSLDTIEAYFDGQQRSQLAQKYGPEITKTQDEYFNLKAVDGNAAKKYLRQHPELKKYWDEKSKMADSFNRAVVDFSSRLPDQNAGAQLRSDFTPQNATQQTLAGLAQKGPASWNDLTAGMQPEVQQIVANYWLNNGKLEKGTKSQLDYLAKQKGFYNADDYLRALGASLQQ